MTRVLHRSGGAVVGYISTCMFVRNFCSSCFLENVLATEPFAEYCAQRGIPFTRELSSATRHEDLRRWRVALEQVPREKQAQIELELAKVRDMADHGAIAQLLTALDGHATHPTAIPGDTALALWFFLRQPDLFHEVFLHLETQDADAWWNAHATADLTLTELPRLTDQFAAGLKALFQQHEGAGTYCAVDARRLNGSYCFVAHVSDRLQFLEMFTEGGEFTMQPLQPALPVIFVYYPVDGTVLLQTRIQSHDRLLELVQLFGRVVLGVDLDGACMGHAFALDCLKERFDPLPDAPDMEMVRVKSLDFAYPERYGRRRVTLETLIGDDKFAILDMIQTHLSAAELLRDVRVSHAELQVKLRVDGGVKSYVIHLWPNRSSLNHNALHERFRACLKQWGLYITHA